MPYFSFATYADYREEWAIRADSLEHARALIGTDIDGDWLNDAVHVDGDVVERRDEFWTEADGETPQVTEITPGHWAYRAAHRDEIDRSLKQNIAALSGDFHTHRRYSEFYDTFGKMINGFVGQYEICIAMGEALTDWETDNGLGEAYDNHGVCWIEIVDAFVDAVIERSIEAGIPADPKEVLATLPSLQPARTP